MSSRWEMNRIGFVNFWLYDEEEFEFCDGKLLLRGQNGSGKSITTQSFIPFILDGDRTPSRLDPFGSSDRRMEYYFLGEEGKDEATGYLFLEFKKSDAEEYRTIGVGQRARRGKPMDFWGFVILDGRRVGYDLFLYKQTGSTKIPYDKKEMKAELGEDNRFTDSQSEYKKLVNQHIFGFRKEEQYEQFIKLLVKVRAPKLSKEFKPTKVYDILNESLQTLSDEELYTMVEAMEKMDEIQDSLEMLNRAFSDIKIIRNEYTRYNQYMIAKKAQSYLQKKDELTKNQQEYDEKQDSENKINVEQQELNEEINKLSADERLVEKEKESLMDTDLDEIDNKLRKAKAEKAETEERYAVLEDKIYECKEKIYKNEQELKNINYQLREHQTALERQKQRLEEHQEIVQWEEHAEVLKAIKAEHSPEEDLIAGKLKLYKKALEECRKTICDFQEISRKYDEIAELLEVVKKEKIAKEQALSEAEYQVLKSQDNWIIQLYSGAETSECWKPAEEVLKKTEGKIREYQSVVDAGAVSELLRIDYEEQRNIWLEKKQTSIQKLHACSDELKLARQELELLQNIEDIEPTRSDEILDSRKKLYEAGIEAIPFYKTVEFADEQNEAERAQLEAQLENIGLLDALVISDADYEKISKYCPEFLDTVIYVQSMGNSDFSKLILSEELPSELAESVSRILSNIYEEPGAGSGIYLGSEGQFLNGILAGRSQKKEAEFLGYLTRKRKKAQRVKSLQDEIVAIEHKYIDLQKNVADIDNSMKILENEYQNIPGFEELDAALEVRKNCIYEAEQASGKYSKIEWQEQECAERKQTKYQAMLKACKPYPYGRTEEEYDEVLGELEEYQYNWQECKDLLLRLENNQNSLYLMKERQDQQEQVLDDAFIEERNCDSKIKECEIQIKQYEEYLNRPDVVENAKRLQDLRDRLEEIRIKKAEINEIIIRNDEKTRGLREELPKLKMQLQGLIAEEKLLRDFFEEELALKLVVERGNRTLAECAKEAMGLLRDSDKNREYGDILQALNQTYQKHNGSLIKYGTSLEECFDITEDWDMAGMEFQPLRKRVRVVSTWNGKKVFLEEFYSILKSTIEETELLIQDKDRELFEDILSQTISQQLTDRISESRSWVKDMSGLMKELDTSMGLSFSLEWKPRSAESDLELDTIELEKILLRDHDLLTMEDIERVAGHFRNKIRIEKMKLEENGGFINYMELVRDALDYRKWFEFKMFYKRGDENRKPLTNAAFNRFSGGEKAMAMYVPLFAAVNAQYKKADYDEHPRIIALDEAFAGVDDKNISSMFELVDKMEFDYIMNSQSLWGCYETVKNLKIAELHRPMNSQLVTVIRYTWNGHERILDVQ